MGLGHIYRTLWLARALRREGREVEFFVTEDLTVKDLLRANGFATRWFSNNLEEFEKLVLQVHAKTFFLDFHYEKLFDNVCLNPNSQQDFYSFCNWKTKHN